MKVKSRHVVFSLIGLVLGFMIAFSYNLTNSESSKHKISDKSWDREYQLRKQLVQQEENTRELQKVLFSKQAEVTAIEQDLSKEANLFFNLAEETEKYRMFLGKVKVKGKGVKVTLEDGVYNPNEENVNNYLVHEQHLFKVINELYISGAVAVAVNGQRLNHNSYIVCNGPVITVDGNQYPAPFVITAIGNPEVMQSALNIAGGVKDQLVNENITFTLEKEDNIVLQPLLGT